MIEILVFVVVPSALMALALTLRLHRNCPICHPEMLGGSRR